MGEPALKGRTVSYCLVSGILLVVHGGVSADEREFQAVADAEAELAFQGVLVVTDPRFPGLSAVQRRMINEAWKRRGHTLPVSVVTTRHFDRATITAMNWFVLNAMKAFAPEEIGAALRYLGVASDATAHAIIERARAVAADLGSTKLFLLPMSQRDSA